MALAPRRNSVQERQRKEIKALTETVSHLKKEIANLETQKYEAYKRIGELTGNRTAS